MRLASKADKGEFRLRGYDGTTAAPHMDHPYNLVDYFAGWP